jgi:pimeloyl-ACP methyl ester carboxylesterase
MTARAYAMTPGTYTPLHRGGTGPPLLLIHGFTDTWRTWELTLPSLERRFDVLAPTLPGHAGGPPLPVPPTGTTLVEWLESLLDDVGWESPLVAGNSLGGWLALQLASRGRARGVVALAPAGDPASVDSLPYFRTMYRLVRRAAPIVDRIVATEEGRRRMTKDLTVRFEHIPADLLAHQLVGAARCDATLPLIELAEREGWPLETAAVRCPVRIVWGREDAILTWPRAAERYRRDLPQADWVELDDVGHAPQLDVPVETADLIGGFA